MKNIVDYSSDLVILEKLSDRIILKSNYPSKFEESAKIYVYYYPSNKKNGKSLLFIHGLGTNNLKYLKWFPEQFSERGYDSYLMILPYHFERTPEGYRSGELFLKPEYLRERFEHAVSDVITTLNFIKTTSSNDKVFLMGFSFGGMISTIATPFSNVDGLSLCVTGGNFYHITWKSFATRVLRLKYEENQECTSERCKHFHGKEYYDYISNLKSPYILKNSAPLSCYEYDPLVFAKFINVPTIMFKAAFDIFIPKRSSEELFEFLGTKKKEIHTIYSGHLSSYIFKGYILKKTIKFFEKNVVV